MEKSDKDFSPQESLQLIQSMIATTKSSIGDSSHYFLLWGWATIIGCVLQYVLLVIVKYPHHYYAWFITIVAVIVHFFFIIRDSKREKVKTFISDANNHVWTIIGFSFMALAFVFSKIGWMNCFPVYILLYGIGTYITGSLIKFMPMRIGGMVCMVLVAIAPYLSYPFQILLAAFAILVSYVIPGHLLRSKLQKEKKFSHAV